MSFTPWWKGVASAGRRSAGIFLRDVGHGLLEVSHNMLALLGLLVLAAVAFMAGRADLRTSFEQTALGWLQERHGAHAEDLDFAALTADAEAPRAVATELSGLSRQQGAVAMWLSRRYRVAPEPVARLVQESWRVGQRVGLEPTLLLAIIAIESGFNPFAQSPVGAQGLMQVMTRVHHDKYAAFGGRLAAFDPVSNLRVGVLVLKECINRAGGLEAGLRYYVGAANLDDDGGYSAKVMAEQRYLQQVASGQAVPVGVTNTTVANGQTGAASAARPASDANGAAPNRRTDDATADKVALAG